MEGDPEPLDPPIHVDWIDPAVLADGLPGRLGLTILPGKRGKSIRYPGLVYRRDARATSSVCTGWALVPWPSWSRTESSSAGEIRR